MDSLSKAIGKRKPIPQKIKYELAVEMAYANFINPEIKTIVKKQTGNTTVYHFLVTLPESDSSHNLLDVAHLYDLKTEAYLGARIDRIPSLWSARPDFPDLPRFFAITHHTSQTTPALVFDKADPFSVVVFE